MSSARDRRRKRGDRGDGTPPAPEQTVTERAINREKQEVGRHERVLEKRKDKVKVAESNLKKARKRLADAEKKAA